MHIYWQIEMFKFSYKKDGMRDFFFIRFSEVSVECGGPLLV